MPQMLQLRQLRKESKKPKNFNFEKVSPHNLFFLGDESHHLKGWSGLSLSQLFLHTFKIEKVVEAKAKASYDL